MKASTAIPLGRVSVLVLLAPVVAIVAAGCPSGGTLDTDGGGGGGGGAGAGGGSGGAPPACGGSSGSSPNANFAYVRTLVADTCGGAGCHNEAPMQPQLMDDAALYTTLTTYTVQLCGNRVLVKPCAPEESAFYLVQRGECADVAQMPFGCVDRCTPPDDIEAIRQWIANGAPQQ